MPMRFLVIVLHDLVILQITMICIFLIDDGMRLLPFKNNLWQVSVELIIDIASLV
jgi:hypothetical protein